jgi:hypothetical protein
MLLRIVSIAELAVPILDLVCRRPASRPCRLRAVVAASAVVAAREFPASVEKSIVTLPLRLNQHQRKDRFRCNCKPENGHRRARHCRFAVKFSSDTVPT